MTLELTADNTLIRIRNLLLLFLFQVIVIGFAFFTSGAYLFFRPKYTPPLYTIFIIAALSTGIVYVLEVTGITERAYKKQSLDVDDSENE